MSLPPGLLNITIAPTLSVGFKSGSQIKKKSSDILNAELLDILELQPQQTDTVFY